MSLEKILQFFTGRTGRVIGVAAFFIIGVLFMTIGFLKTVFVVFMCVVGYGVGLFIDDPEKLRKIINTYLGK